ncbi:unnamed protein product [Didymodactylos carnosus]|uniref:EGF domain-specific O-linked N-acetylglucosamine transferase n=1 Tax=Didymodactylos carnosus TaxID=1234261 RepID=A0A814L803_9BILA|nr:unnamed protein product [Didymodactylos carnosus]CAF1468755.1 unnamed protein product [Didymodactylos carnosus]CAF3830322.1 unnamed protein product [Didymodactylos carnosus]CAF4260875.1 unnamed protein product [Didymodactylos carnosus]
MFRISLLLSLYTLIQSYNWTQLNLPTEHVPYFFYNNPLLRSTCINEGSVFCPYYEQAIDNSTKCWGYESDCQMNNSNRSFLVQCPDDSRGWTTSKEKQIHEFWRQGDFGYIAEKRNELRSFCTPIESDHDSSSLECVDHIRYCHAKNIYIDFKNIQIEKHYDRYREDILEQGDVGGKCTLNKDDLTKNGDQKSPLQSWYSELRVFTPLNDSSLLTKKCDIIFDKPTYLIKLDSSNNMYHHFCDFINFYVSQHMNNTFSLDIQIILWDTSNSDYWSYFSDTWKAFSSNPLIHLKSLNRKRVCFKDAVFTFLARMFFGLYYNMPLIPGCTNTNLFRSFQQYVLHRLNVKQYGPLKSNLIRITLLNRTTQYRQILNFNEIIQHLQAKSNNEYVINVVDYNMNVPFLQQLNITYNTDIFMGIHGAGLTHLLFLPDWATIFEIYNCEDKDCYLDLARLRGVKYFTWENGDKVYPQDEGRHPTMGTPHKKFTNYAFDVNEFERVVRKMVKYVKEHPAYRLAKRLKYKKLDEHKGEEL